MSVIHSDDSVVLVQAARAGIQVSTFPDIKQMVMLLLDSGSLGGGTVPFHGSPVHIKALREIIMQSKIILRRIEEETEKGKA